MTITFFGHHDASEDIAPALDRTLIDLIEHHHATLFYVGNQGRFDAIVRRTLGKLSQVYPHIKTLVILAYMPTTLEINFQCDTLFPDGLEYVPPKYAIYKRNEWMLARADVVITHVLSPTGGAAAFKRKAEKAGKTVINI